MSQLAKRRKLQTLRALRRLRPKVDDESDRLIGVITSFVFIFLLQKTQEGSSTNERELNQKFRTPTEKQSTYQSQS